VVVAVGNGETCVRRSVQTKSWTDRVCGAKQRHGSCGLSSAEAKATIRLLYPFWCARSASKGDQPAHTPLYPPCAADLNIGAVDVARFGTQEIAYGGHGIVHRANIAGRNAFGHWGKFGGRGAA
jgi:hypothetical protein